MCHRLGTLMLFVNGFLKTHFSHYLRLLISRRLIKYDFLPSSSITLFHPDRVVPLHTILLAAAEECHISIILLMRTCAVNFVVLKTVSTFCISSIVILIII